MNTPPLDTIILSLRQLLGAHDYEQALAASQNALKYYPDNAILNLLAGNACRLLNRFDDAAHYFRSSLNGDPTFFAAACNLGVALRTLGKSGEALHFLKQAIAIKPASFEAFANAGLACQDLHLHRDAFDFFTKAVANNPRSLAMHLLLIDHAIGMGDLDIAKTCISRACSLFGDLPELSIAVGRCFLIGKDLHAAREYFLKALRIVPGNADAHFYLGNIMSEWKHPDEAVVCYRNALKSAPERIDALVNLGESMMLLGETDQAEACFTNAIKQAPSCELARHNLLVAMNYNARYTQKEVDDAHHTWGLRCASLTQITFTGTDRNPDRQLRIGFLSPDFCNHPAAAFLEPMLRNADPDMFTLFCYSQTTFTDDTTGMFASLAKKFTAIDHLDDEAVTSIIANDQIDILIDTAGHFTGNRLGVFARKPAPLQIRGIGYPGITGLAAFDFRLTDTVIDPISSDSINGEKPLYIDPCFCCYTPPVPLPEVHDAPCLKNGYITFGSLHTTSRLTDATITLWSSVLSAIPTSRMLICRTTLSASVKSRILSAFNALGIAPSRITLLNEIPQTGHLTVYNHIDIALDTVPWSGHTTACEALCMGVPVITIKGNRHSGRMVSSILSATGNINLVASAADQFVNIATDLSSDASALDLIRKSFRSRLLNSPLCDARRYMKTLEKKYREIWREWCAFH